MGDVITDLNGPGVRVLLVGTGTHEGTAIPPVLAVKDTLDDLEQTLVEQCGVRAANVRKLLDPPDPQVVRLALTQAAQEADDTLLFYYVGHGLRGSDNRLYLATKSTNHLVDGLPTTALPFSFVRDMLNDVGPRVNVAVLDCCFSGQAVGSLGKLTSDVFELATTDGSYVLMSAGREEMALAPPGQRHTAFSGELIRGLREGDAAYPPQLTLEHLTDLLTRRLLKLGYPQPRSQSSGRAGHLVLTRNPAALEPPKGPDVPSTANRGRCPYLGLDAFGANDARYFHGRDELIRELVRKLADRLSAGGPLAVLGPSGSGKSSLLHAGLVPALQRGAIEVAGSAAWPCHSITPGEHPLGTLARRFGATQPLQEIMDQLLADPNSFTAVVRQWLRKRSMGIAKPGRRLILIVDQFEELFTECSDERERVAFLRALVAVCTSHADAGRGPDGDHEEPPAAVVLGVRADFYGHCLEYQELVPTLHEGQVLVRPMDEHELRDAIEKPAATAGLGLQDGLVDRLLQDLHAGHRPTQESGGALPLLSYALMTTWQHSGGGPLTLVGYQATGGIWRAVAHEAERVYEGLDPQHRVTARRLLQRMVRVSDSGEDTRRRVDLDDLRRRSPAEQTEAIDKVCEEFAEARLITFDQNHAQITHEALLRAWPRLRQWIETDRAGNLIRQDLEEASAAWDRENRENSTLYRGTRLDVAQNWAKEHRDDVSHRTAEFLAASARQKHRATWLRRLAVALPSVLALIASVLTYVAFQQRSVARTERDNAIVSQIIAQANRFRSTDASLAAQLDLVAYRMRPDDRNLYTNLVTAATAPLSVELTGETGPQVDSVALSNDGRILATASVNDNRSVRLWNIADLAHPTPLGQPLIGHTGDVFSIAFSPDKRTMATGSSDQTVRLWNIANPEHPIPLGQPLTGHTKLVASLAFSHDGHILASGGAGEDQTVRLWNVSDPAHPSPLRTFTGRTVSERKIDPPVAIAFSPNSPTLAISSLGEGKIQLWDLANPDAPKPIGKIDYHTIIESMVFDQEGSILATASFDRAIRLWNVTDRSNPTSLGEPLTGHTESVTGVAFDPTGYVLATSSSDQTVRLWNVADPTHPKPLGEPLRGHDDAVSEVTFSSDGHTLVSRGVDPSPSD